MRFAKYLPLLLTFAGLTSARTTANASQELVASSSSVAYVAGLAAVTVVDQPGASVDVWAVAANGELVQVAHGVVGSSGAETVLAPDLGAGFLIVGMNGDIRDWLE